MSNHEERNGPAELAVVAPGRYQREHSIAGSRNSIYLGKLVRVVTPGRVVQQGRVVACHDYLCGSVFVVDCGLVLRHVAVPDYDEVATWLQLVASNDG